MKKSSHLGWGFGAGWDGDWDGDCDGQQRWKGEFSPPIFVIPIISITISSISWARGFQQCNKKLRVIFLGPFSHCMNILEDSLNNKEILGTRWRKIPTQWNLLDHRAVSPGEKEETPKPHSLSNMAWAECRVLRRGEQPHFAPAESKWSKKIFPFQLL